MGKNIRVLCPNCKHIDHRGGYTGSVNPRRRIGYCFFCGRAIVGSDLDRAFALSGISVKDTLLGMRRDYSVNCRKNYKWIPFDKAPSVVKNRAERYLISRGCPLEFIDKYDFKIGLQDLAGRIVIPVYEDDRLVYFQARAFVSDKEPKYLNPSKQDGLIGKSDVVAFLDIVLDGSEFAICEGLFTAIAVIENLLPAVSVLGHTLSDTQAIKIARKNPKRVYLAFDQDVTDYELRTTADKLRRLGVDVEFIRSFNGDFWDIFYKGKGEFKKIRRL